MRTTRPAPGPRPLAGALVAVVLLVGGAACGVDGGDAVQADVTTPAEREVGTESAPGGGQVVAHDDVGLSLVVPDDWEVQEVDAETLVEGGAEVLADDPLLSGMVEQSAAMTGDATSLAASSVDPGGEGVVVIQLQLSLPAIPEMMVETMQGQLETLGATDVLVERRPVPGPDGEVQVLAYEATLDVAGRTVTQRAMMVPTDAGLALVTVTAGAERAEEILGSVEVG